MCAGGKAKPLKQPKSEKKEYDEVFFLTTFSSIIVENWLHPFSDSWHDHELHRVP